MANSEQIGVRLLNILAEEYETMYKALEKIEGQAVVAHMAVSQGEAIAMLNNCYLLATSALNKLREREEVWKAE
jgi:hypothetical protein